MIKSHPYTASMIFEYRHTGRLTTDVQFVAHVKAIVYPVTDKVGGDAHPVVAQERVLLTGCTTKHAQSMHACATLSFPSLSSAANTVKQ